MSDKYLEMPVTSLQKIITRMEDQVGSVPFHTLCVLVAETLWCREFKFQPGHVRLRIIGEGLKTMTPLPPRISLTNMIDRLLLRPRRPLCISYGMGVDSTAMLIYLARMYHSEKGRCPQYRPDMITFADTGNEKKETYDYLPVINEYLRRVGFPEIVVINYEPSWTKNGDYYTLEQNCLVNRTLPSLAFGFKKCSNKWKITPQNNYRETQPECQAAWKAGLSCIVAIGYDAGPKDSCRSWDITDDLGYEYIYPLIELGWDRERCIEEIRKEGLAGWENDKCGKWLKKGGVPVKSACWYCFAGETEIVTDKGIHPIKELAGGTHNLLAPILSAIPNKPGRKCLSGQGRFVAAEVKSFGVQPMMKIVLTQGLHEKEIYATAEHRWFIWSTRKNPRHRGSHPTTVERTTEGLVPGDKIRELKVGVPAKVIRMPFAVAQGFVFGDGTRGTGKRPASLHIYDNQKDDALVPYFGMHEMTTYESGTRHIYGLPRTWKQLPSIQESKSFLVSWLAGYFAADGDVGEGGTATLNSASENHIRFARDVMAVCGIGYGKIGNKLRDGIDGKPGWLYRINIDVRDLPDWFFLIEEHARRILERKRRAPKLRSSWTVKIIEKTDRIEEVFCAVVPEVGAFGLADGLMTGNCPSTQPEELVAFSKTPHGRDYLRAIIRMEANAAPKLTKIEGLWRNGVKGTRGGKAKPGSMTQYIEDNNLLRGDKRKALPLVDNFYFSEAEEVAGVL